MGRDVFGRLGGVAAGEQSAGNVFESDDREAEEQVEEAGNFSLGYSLISYSSPIATGAGQRIQR